MLSLAASDIHRAVLPCTSTRVCDKQPAGRGHGLAGQGQAQDQFL